MTTEKSNTAISIIQEAQELGFDFINCDGPYYTFKDRANGHVLKCQAASSHNLWSITFNEYISENSDESCWGNCSIRCEGHGFTAAKALAGARLNTKLASQKIMKRCLQ